jgi:hypothetical protein
MNNPIFSPEPFEYDFEGPTAAPPAGRPIFDSSWEPTISIWVAEGERDENRMTDTIFYQGHSELNRRRLRPDEHQLIQQWLDIRDRLVRPVLRGFLSAPKSPPQPALPNVWDTSPLPASETPRFAAALTKLAAKVNAGNDPRKWRYQCWINKLKNRDVDDRVIGWHRICPTGNIVAPFYIWPCDMSMGSRIAVEELGKAVHSVADVDSAGPSLGIITYLKSSIVVSEEMTTLPMENLQTLHDDVVNAIDKLGAWANSGIGGSSSMHYSYVAIKDWIAARQSDPKSIYSCL